MKKDGVALRFALIVGLVIILPLVLVFAFGGLGVMRGGGRVAGMLWTRDGWVLFYTVMGAIVITAVLFLILRIRRRT